MLLRQEARALSWSLLEEAQKQAIKRVVDLLIAAIESIPGDKKDDHGGRDPDSFRIDDDRASRIVLLSGRRGTGKTTVLLTLRDLCKSKRGQSLDAEIEHGIDQVADRAIWLEPIDMEPLTESTNLLAAVLARIDDAAQGPQGLDGDVKPRGILDPGANYQDALLELQRLENNVALAWDGNLASRSAHLDPDHYAVEVMRAERERLALNRKVKDVLDKLAKDVFRDKGREKAKGGRIFIIPVDDFDLNPVRCLDLLRILRMISVPRLFALVLGDVKVAENVFNLKLCGDLNRLAHGLEGSKLISYVTDDVLTMTRAVAASAMRKLIPPAQVVRLEFMTAGEALSFRPAGTDGTSPLHKILEQSPLYEKFKAEPYQERQELENLRRFFLVQPFRMVKSAPIPGSHPDAAEPKKSREEWLAARKKKAEDFARISNCDQIQRDEVNESPYMVRELFQTSPRKIADLWQGLARLEDAGKKLVDANKDWKNPAGSSIYLDFDPKPQTPPVVLEIINVFGRHCEQAISEDRMLTPAGKQRLHDALRAESRHWQLDTSAFRAVLKEWPEHAFEFPSTDVPDADSQVYTQVMHARRFQGWRIDALVSRDNKRIRVPMERPTAAALMAVHDLIALAQAGPDGETLWEEMASRRRKPQVKAATGWRVFGNKNVKIVWPDYHWTSFREYDLFTSLWKEAIDWVDRRRFPSELQLEHLVFAWIDIHYAVLEWDDPIGFCRPRDDGVSKVGPDWEALKDRLVSFFNVAEKLQKRGERHVTQYPPLGWYTRFACLLMPESIGSHELITKAMFGDEKMIDIYRHWHENRAYICSCRRANYEKFHNAGLGWLGRKLCGRPPVGQEKEPGPDRAAANKKPSEMTCQELLGDLVPVLPGSNPQRG